MLIKKLFLLVFLSINIVPRTATTLKNRFANIKITSFRETMKVHTLRYTFVSSVKCSVDLKAIVINSQEIATTIGSTTTTISDNYTGTFTLRSSAINNGDTLLLSAQSDTYYCVREFKIYLATNTYQTITKSTTYTRDDAVQICDANGYQQRYKESIKVSFGSKLFRRLPYITVTSLKIDYQCNYSVKHELEGKEAFLIINDVDNNFPLLQDNNKIVKISYLLKEISTDTYQMRLNEKLYYNPTTLFLSRVAKDGFIPTNTIYIPKNSKTKQLITIYQLTNLGYQTINLNIKSINTFGEFVGSCSTSKYCVRIYNSDNYMDDNEMEIELR